MNTPNLFDILVVKEFETTKDGVTEKRKKWNRVGRAWSSKSGDSLNFELFLIPYQNYVIQLKDRRAPETKTETIPF